MNKTIDDYFTDWEAYVFGYGYGTGEAYIIPALKKFLSLCDGGPVGHAYDHEKIESYIGPATAWLLINALCHADIIEYGTSPRFGWLTKKGERLQDFVNANTADRLLELTDRDQDYPYCFPDGCNCGEYGYDENAVCKNPFWMEKL